MKKVLDSLGQGIERVNRIFGYIACHMIMVLLIFLVINVIMRYLVKRPFSFTEEMTGYLLSFIVFIGLGYTMMAGAHVITNVLVRHLSGKTSEILIKVRNLFGILFALLLTISAWELMIKNYVSKTIDFGALETPSWIPNIIFVVGSTVFLLEVIVIFIKSINKRGK